MTKARLSPRGATTSATVPKRHRDAEHPPWSGSGPQFTLEAAPPQLAVAATRCVINTEADGGEMAKASARSSRRFPD